MNAGTYFGWNGDYNGLGYVKGYVGAQLPEHNDSGEYAYYERDKEYYASKYFQIFARIVRAIEREELTFSSKKERNAAWNAAGEMMCKYREREYRYREEKLGRTVSREDFLYRHGYYPDA